MSYLESALFDANNLLYCTGGATVWCMDLDLKPRWQRPKPEDFPSAPRIALDRKQHRLLVWARRKHSAQVWSAADGGLLATVGGREPDGASGPQELDAFDFDHVTGDLDGTMLAKFRFRLLRYDGHGTRIATWPNYKGFLGLGKEKLSPLYHQFEGKRCESAGDKVYYDDIGGHPTRIDDYSSFFIGWDGRLYIVETGVTCFDREGGKAYRTRKLEDLRARACGADAKGNVYLRREISGEPSARSILRVSPDGKRIDEIATDRRRGGSVGQEQKLAVAADGTLFTYGSREHVRIFDATGKLVHQTPASKQADAEEAAADAKRA